MKMPRVPNKLIAEVASLPVRLTAAGHTRHLEKGVVDDLISFLPEQICKSPCFLCKLTNLWRYDFGEPIDLASEQIVTGTHMFPPVDRLLDVVLSQTRLHQNTLQYYLGRLSNPAKHQDVLAEFAPIVHLDSSVSAEFEVNGFSSGNRTIDWLLRPGGGSPILLEVKNRIRDLIEGMERIARGERTAGGEAPDPQHNCDLLFQGVVEKFVSRNTSEYLQGAWIITHIAQEETEILQAYARLDQSRLHFAVLNNWSQDAYILARDDLDLSRLLSVFGLRKSDRFVFARKSGISKA